MSEQEHKVRESIEQLKRQFLTELTGLSDKADTILDLMYQLGKLDGTSETMENLRSNLSLTSQE